MAGWNSGGSFALPLSPEVYVCQIADVSQVEGKPFKDKPAKDRFKWTVDVWMGNQWVRKALYTGIEFQDASKVSGAQWMPELMKLVRACGRPLPQTPAEALAWNANDLIGVRFGVRMETDEAGAPQKRYVQILDAAPQQHAPVPQVAAPTAPQPVPVQAAAPPAPVTAPPPPSAQTAPPPAQNASEPDPFDGDAGAIPPVAPSSAPHPAHMPPPAATGADVWA